MKEKMICDDLKDVLKQAKKMGRKEVTAFRNIPLVNVEIVISALQKQIPKSHSCITDSDSVTCENCGSDVDKDYENFEYCPYCGQKL